MDKVEVFRTTATIEKKRNKHAGTQSDTRNHPIKQQSFWDWKVRLQDCEEAQVQSLLQGLVETGLYSSEGLSQLLQYPRCTVTTQDGQVFCAIPLS